MTIIELLMVASILASAFRGAMAGSSAGFPGAALGLLVGGFIGLVFTAVSIILFAGAAYLVPAGFTRVTRDEAKETAAHVSPPTFLRRLLTRVESVLAGFLATLVIAYPLLPAWLGSLAVRRVVGWIWG